MNYVTRKLAKLGFNQLCKLNGEKFMSWVMLESAIRLSKTNSKHIDGSIECDVCNERVKVKMHIQIEKLKDLK